MYTHTGTFIFCFLLMNDLNVKGFTTSTFSAISALKACVCLYFKYVCISPRTPTSQNLG